MKSLILTAGLMTSAVGASAQNCFGLTVGYNASTCYVGSDLYGPHVVNYYKSGYNAGFAYEHRFAPLSNGGYWLIDVNLLFSMEGYRSHYEFNKNSYMADYVFADEEASWDDICDIGYLKLPIGVGFNFRLNDKIGLAPKLYQIFEKDMLENGRVYSYNLFELAFGLGGCLKIKDHLTFEIGYDWKRCFGNAHANLTYYFFKKPKEDQKNAE